MAAALVRIDDLRRGRLPRVCAKTGAPADEAVTITFTRAPSWTWILLLFGVLPFLIARWFSRTRVAGAIPLSTAALRRGRTVNRVGSGLLLVGTCLVLLAIVLRPVLAGVGLGVALAGLVGMGLWWPFVWPIGRIEGDWVRLSSVHPDFARELDRFYGGSNRTAPGAVEPAT